MTTMLGWLGVSVSMYYSSKQNCPTVRLFSIHCVGCNHVGSGEEEAINCIYPRYIDKLGLAVGQN